MNLHLKESLFVLNNGGVILSPTDTIWGLACAVYSSVGIAKINQIKNRPQSKSYIILFPSFESVRHHVGDIHPMLINYIENSTEAVSIIIHNKKRLIFTELETLAVRVPKAGFIKELCDLFGKPIISTSANISSEKTPSIFTEVSIEIKRLVDYIVFDSNSIDIAKKPSQIIKMDQNKIINIR